MEKGQLIPKSSKIPESVLIAVDIEGITGVYDKKQCTPYTSEWAQARDFITCDVNAAIKGLLACGVKNIIVRDLHGPGFNIRKNKLAAKVTCIQGFSWRPIKIFGRIPNVDCAIMLGWHVGPDQPEGFSPHICHKSLKSLRVNKKPITEVEFFSALLGEYDIPVAFLSADAATIACVTENMPWIHTCPIPKEKLSTEEMAQVHTAIEAQVIKAITSPDAIQPLIWKEHVVDMITDRGHFSWKSASWLESYTRILEDAVFRKEVRTIHAFLIPYRVYIYRLISRLKSRKF